MSLIRQTEHATFQTPISSNTLMTPHNTMPHRCTKH